MVRSCGEISKNWKNGLGKVHPSLAEQVLVARSHLRIEKDDLDVYILGDCLISPAGILNAPSLEQALVNRVSARNRRASLH
jgi:hypothetical protein